MTVQALGLIEAVGLPVAIEAADAALKAANVTLVGYEKTRGGGLIVVKIRGDVGAVKAAVEAAVASASRVGKVYAHHVIPHPHDETEPIVNSVDRGPQSQPPLPAEPPKSPPPEPPKKAPPETPKGAAAGPKTPAPRKSQEG
jgi:ethanolamine utilization protein EutM